MTFAIEVVTHDGFTGERRLPSFGMSGSRSSNVEETIEWALRAEATTEESR